MILRKTERMVLIDGGGHQLRSFEQPLIISGIWYLVSFKEISASSTAHLIKERTFKNPFPVLLDLEKRLLIYRYGGRASKPMVCDMEQNGCISTPHLYNEALLTGIYNHQSDALSMSLRYLNTTDFTVFLEFRKTPTIL
jgi:hypothetical protein